MPLEGQHIDRYHILRLLGGGGMGDVYLAEDPHLGQQVAIKVIRTEPGAYPNANAPMKVAHLFYREAKAIVKLDHPHFSGPIPAFSSLVWGARANQFPHTMKEWLAAPLQLLERLAT